MSSDPLSSLGAHVAEQENALLAATEHEADGDATRRRLVQRVLERTGSAPRAQRSRVGQWLALAAGVVLTLSGLAFAHWLRSDGKETLRFTVGERDGVVQALEAAPAAAGLPLRFSDGSLLELSPGARARVAALRSDGADVLLESGHARMDVVPRREGAPAHWQLRSGPFSVQVKGTSFWLSWDPEANTFSLDLLAGQVLVTGCNLGNGRELHAGERLEASCRTEPAAIPATAPAPLDLPATVSRDLPPVTQPTPPAAAPAEPPHSHAVRRGSLRSGRHLSWQELAHQGDFRGAYALATSSSWDAELRGASGEDLLLLGQAARLTGHVAPAERAYAAVRRRFAGSPAAARAAFSLGLLAFDATPSEAIEWLETYLAEQPAGSLSEAALDRLLEAALRLNDPALQRRIAQRYLEQAAQGPHAAQARRMLASSRATE